MFPYGHEVAGYRILRMIGQGGMAQVFLAEQVRLRRQVALKIVRLDVKADLPPGKAEPAEELTREAQTLMALEHPHILPLYDAGREEDMAYLVMPYIPEGSLQQALRPGPQQLLQFPLPPGEALFYLEQAASALQYAHDRGFVHRDIKPANFLVRSLTSPTDKKQTVKRLHLFLADFGLSKFVSYSSSSTRISGTPIYMAPEQFQGRVSPASDQYALAALLYYLLTGETPFSGGPVELMFQHLNESPPLASERTAGLPESLARVIQRGMAKKPGDRYSSVTEFADAARDALVAAGLALPHESLPAVAAVRPPERPAAQPAPDAPQPPAGEQQDRKNVDVAATSAPTEADPDFAKVMAGAKKSAESSLPTLAMEPKRGPSSPPPPGQSAPQPPRRRGRVIALAALAAILVIGGVFGARLLLQQPQHSPQAASTQQTQQQQTPTATVALPTATPTVVPASSILTSILSQNPHVLALLPEPGQWPYSVVNSASYHRYTNNGSLDLLGVSVTYTAQTFPTPLAVAIDLTAGSNPEFDIILNTSNTGNTGGAHLFYRLQLKTGQPPQTAHSTDGKNFTSDGAGTMTDSSWADGSKHTLIYALDGTRLLFYLDMKPLLDVTVAQQPYPMAALTLASFGEAFITGIRIYNVP